MAEHFNMEVEPAPPKESLKLVLYADNLKVDIFRSQKYPVNENEYLLFDDMYKNHKDFKDRDFSIAVPSLEDLKKSKLTRNSPKNKEDIKYIELLLERKNKMK